MFLNPGAGTVQYYDFCLLLRYIVATRAGGGERAGVGIRTMRRLLID